MTTKKDDGLSPSQEKKLTELIEKLTNKDRRTIVKYFDEAYEDLEGMDHVVVAAWLGEGKSKPLSHYDELPINELSDAFTAVLGE